MAFSQWMTAILSLSLLAKSAHSQSTEPACGQIVNALGGMNAPCLLSGIPFQLH